MWSVGQKIGDYELLAHLRSGGMAMLFLARRLGAAGFTREVAIKIVNPELAVDSQFRTMFLDEAQVSSRISHPNVVRVEELGEYAGAHYLVMEYVHGASLSQLQRQLFTRGRRLLPAFAARIAMHVAEGLHAAHETSDAEGRPLQVVHRDVTPENILLAYAGHVKLIDFGIAKAYGRRHKTQEGLLKGKFRYMAPEQAYGRAIDRRTDIYQLGIVLWEMLTLRRLFDAETDTELIQQVRSPHIVAPGTQVARIPPALDAAVMCALDPDPARRPPDAQSFARMLGRAVPEAYEVDGGALSALVLATMHEQREREKHTFPEQLYESLERQVPTAPDFAAPHGGAAPVIRRYTLEHTAPHGSDLPEQAQPPAQPARTGTRPGHGPDAGARVSVPGPRARRLVRLASGVRTTFTSMAGAGSDRRTFWLSVAGAIAAAGALALVTLLVRGRARPPVPLPPRPPVGVSVAAGAAPGSVVTPESSAPLAQAPSVGDGSPDAGVFALEERQVMVAPERSRPPREQAQENEAQPSGRRLARPVDIDGTPMIPEF